MPGNLGTLDSTLDAVDRALGTLRPHAFGPVATALERWHSDAEAIRFHLRPRLGDQPMLVAILGGTGTGKSTLMNRLLGARLSATSFRRTFTSGAVAVTANGAGVPQNWLGLQQTVVAPENLPARGQADNLTIVREDRELTRQVTLIDTPDLDGDQPIHHAQADRVFRWAQALIFLVTPEKYQMTELLPYYRLARRYGVPSVFVMNKADGLEVVQDYRKQIAEREWPDPRVYAIPRDDALWEPPVEMSLGALRQEVSGLRMPEEAAWRSGVRQRAADLLDRLQDQVITPLRAERRNVDRIIASVRALETPQIGVDVNPITDQLQRRLQHRSVLYLMSPQRVLERARQLPGMMLRLPRTLWDVMVRGRGITLKEPPPAAKDVSPEEARQVPDFAATVTDQFTVVQSRIEDVLRSNPASQRWLVEREQSWRQVRMDPQLAGSAAREELGALEKWLDERWNATPRDTVLLMRLLRYLPGGEKLTKWTESAPYLLAVIVATHHSFFGPIDLLVLGGFSLATWLSEKLSNEVSQRARQTNTLIAQRFAELAHEQIEKACAWADQQAPSEKDIAQLEQSAEKLGTVLEEEYRA